MRMLGRIELLGSDGRDLEALLRQPKRLALLAFLASPAPGAWHRRDTVLALFWPELDGARGRTALRNALYVLRQNLDDGAIRTRGDDEISLATELFATDVGRFRAAIAEGRPDEALSLYQGELLPGLYVQDAEGFEKWLDEERGQLRSLARRAALDLAAGREAAGDLAGAADAAGRALELDPDDESTVRLRITLLDRAGDRAQALATFDRFRERLAREFGAEPADETARQVAEIKRRRGTVEATRVPPAVSSVEDATGDPTGSTRQPTRRQRPSRRRILLATGLLASAVLAAVLLPRRARPAASGPREVLLAPMANAAGDPALDYVATGLLSDLATRLGAIGGLRIRSGANARWPESAVRDLPRAGRVFGAQVVLDSRLTRDADSLVVTMAAIDVASGERRDAPRIRFTEASLQDAGSRLAAEAAGTLFRTALPAMPAGRPSTQDPESYRLTLDGWYRQLSDQNDASLPLFLRAIDRDPTNARAWAGVSSAWAAAAVTWRAPFQEAAARATAAAERAIALDSLQGSAWASLGIVRALAGGGLAVGEELIGTAIRLEPANPELHLVAQALYRHAWLWDKARDAVRIARALDPLGTMYVEREGTVLLCAGRDAEALELYRTALAMDSSDAASRRGLVRALSRLGRFDDALDAWRAFAEPGDSALADARGEAGFWRVSEIVGRRQLERSRAAARSGWVSPTRLAIQTVAAGRIDEGLAALEAAHAAGDVGLYRLPCLDGLDRVRRDPRYLRLLASIERARLR
ncbi:MAG: BTAD domain-containing putative transcriptional regulator [Gemmatimonadales bacterium]